MNKENTQKGNIVLMVLIIIILIIAGFMILNNPAGSDDVIQTVETQETSQDSDENMNDSIDEGSEMSDGEMVSFYSEYSGMGDLISERRNILFFHATWCPTCRALDSSLSSATDTPDNVSVFKVDYDSNTELRQHNIHLLKLMQKAA
jgi:thiol-disulfide isomerase/thioredoxin